MADASVKQQIVDKLKDSSNILVTVNSNPSVDELSAALGLTLLINKLNKHATAVFSGAIPSAIEFLNPEKTFESTVDSLRDFIISLDKEKADHLRYKVDGDVVKIFITPYRTVINENDLDFSQGDYNVEMVIAIGVQSEQELDKALVSHGRILHDATVASLSLSGKTELGTLNWADPDASSYSEMAEAIAELVKSDKKLIDEQIATAFLTGIVAATERFSNNKTSSDVMAVAARLMSAGANQQLIATKLEEAEEFAEEAPEQSGSLEEGARHKIDRSEEPAADVAKKPEEPGSLAINHEIDGTVDEVAAKVAAENQHEAAEVAEEKLAEELGSTLPAPVALSAEAVAKDLEQAVPDEPLRGAVSVDQWQRPADPAEPSFGGTLNATTEQAAVDKQREIDDDRNRTILSHDGSAYVTDTPMFQAPLNALSLPPSEPTVPDITSGDGSMTTHADTIQPPAPIAQPPTLAEIDAQNRAQHQDALSAVTAAYEELPTPPPLTPSQPVGQSSLPPLPPLPDFSTLPPLPPGMEPSAPLLQDSPLGEALPPSNAMPVAAQPTDPTQFRIPGQ